MQATITSSETPSLFQKRITMNVKRTYGKLILIEEKQGQFLTELLDDIKELKCELDTGSRVQCLI